MKKQSEQTLLEDYLGKKLDSLGVVHFKGVAKGNKGFPDRVVYADKIYHIECKLGKVNGSYYEQTKMQEKWEKQIRQSGNPYHIVETREEIDILIKDIEKNCSLCENFFAYRKKR